MLTLYNYLTRKKDEFRPLQKGRAGLYTCGPTVYNFAHIGNLRTYVFEDILRRALAFKGLKVKHVMNITDVGHLTSDADTGEDKLEAGAEREKKSVWDIAKFYTEAFRKDIRQLNILPADILTPATGNVPEQIRIIKQLFRRGYAYETPLAVYFHVPKFKPYTKFSRQPLAKQLRGARKEVVTDPAKKHPADFVLWFKLAGRYEHHVMQWPSPWGRGFPGWHIECSAISTKYLGQPFDIHTGGIDHVTVHHTNEIAQSEGAYGKPLAKYWLEGEYMMVDGKKMSKSLGNFYTLADVVRKGYDPLDFRYLVLGAHYRTSLNFTWKGLDAARATRRKLNDAVVMLRTCTGKSTLKEENEVLKVIAHGEHEFRDAVEDDLNTPQALAALHELVHYATSIRRIGHCSPRTNRMLFATITEFDRVLGLRIGEVRTEAIPAAVQKLVVTREQARKQKQWQESDRLRAEIQKHGYRVEDTPKGTRVRKR